MSEPDSQDVEPTEFEPDAHGDDEGGNPAWLKIAIVGGLLIGGVVTLMLGSDAGDAFTYSKTLEEVVDDPASFADRELRVEGLLRQGSIQFREDPCEWRFVLEGDEREMAVEFPQCVVPDTFRDGFGITVTVQGTIHSDGIFHASEVVPRCPSKYEMDQMQQQGEQMPHAANSPG